MASSLSLYSTTKTMHDPINIRYNHHFPPLSHHHFPPLSRHFLFYPLQLSCRRNYSHVEKILGTFAPWFPSQFTPTLRYKRRVFGRLFNSELEKIWKEILESNFNILLKNFSRPWISNPRCVRYYYVARVHICNLCIDYKNYAIIYAVTHTTWCYFSTCRPQTNPK